MRILFFINTMGAGGKERRLTELMKALNLMPDIEFELVVMSNEIHYKEVLDLRIKIHFLIRKNKKDISIFKKFYKICKDFKPEIVHCWDSMTAIYSVPACKLLNINIVNGMVADTPVKQNILNKRWLFGKLTFPFSSIIIGNSKAGLSAYGAPNKKATCIYNGMDLTRFDKLTAPSIIRKEIFGDLSTDYFVVGMVATFYINKDYETLIKAAISLTSKNNKIRFVLVGSGVDFYKIKNSVPPFLSKQIIFLGRRSDIESIINIFNVGVLLTNSKTHGEGISNSILEYMALRKPVIATKGGGTNEVVLDKQSGYLIDAHNESQLVEKIESMIKQQKEIIEMGERGYQEVREKFDVKIMAARYVSVYHKLLNKKKR